MFLISTYLKESDIQGMGVFTAVPVAKGTVIWDIHPWVDWFLTREQLDSIPEPFRTRIWRYCYMNSEGLYVFCGDNGKFMNHSDTPNCEETGVQTIAGRDLAADEELTCDYTTFDFDPDGHPDRFTEPD